MIAFVAKLLLPLAGEKFARPAAWVAIALVASLLIWGGKSLYDNGVIESYVDKANAEFFAEKDEVAGKADIESDERRAEHEDRIKTTEELIDEAIEKGCAVGEYLASVGANCVR